MVELRHRVHFMRRELPCSAANVLSGVSRDVSEVSHRFLSDVSPSQTLQLAVTTGNVRQALER